MEYEYAFLTLWLFAFCAFMGAAVYDFMGGD
jgi:hypothetical protein